MRWETEGALLSSCEFSSFTIKASVPRLFCDRACHGLVKDDDAPSPQRQTEGREHRQRGQHVQRPRDRKEHCALEEMKNRWE